MHSLDDWYEAVEEATNPETASVQWVLALAAANDRHTAAVLQVRQGLDTLVETIGEEGWHAQMLREEMGDVAEALGEVAGRLVSTYARYRFRMQSCKCGVCMAASADLN